LLFITSVEGSGRGLFKGSCDVTLSVTSKGDPWYRTLIWQSLFNSI